MSGMTIGVLAEEVGVSIDTVRYYERRGLLPAPPRTKAGYRTYGADDAWRLGFILRAKDLGFTLKEIDGLFAHAGDAAAVRAAAARKLEAVAEQRHALDAVEARLRNLVQICDDGDDGCATLEAPCGG